jgi:PAS domain S-box-containing protein
MVDLNNMKNDLHYLESELTDLFDSQTDTWRYIQSASLDGVWYWDLENPDNLWISPEYWECLGIDPASRKHSPEEFIKVVFEEDLPNIIDNLERHYADPSVVYEQIVRFKHIDGSTVWVRCRGRATRDANGKAIRMLGAHNNITALKEAELATQRIMKNRERFFARMSHEIRTPLHGMIGIAEVLKNQDTDPNVKAQLTTILNCGKQLQHLLNDLLTLSKIDENKFTVGIEDVSLASVFIFIESLFRAKAEAKSLNFEVTKPTASLVVNSDPIRLTQIVSNLVGNAIKFTQQGKVSISACDHGDTIDLVIADTGEGIADIAAAMSAYSQQGTHSDIESEGTGLGLEIVAKLCDALGHTLNIQSTVGEGTYIVLSIEKSATQGVLLSSQETPVDASSSAKIDLSVLVVDDNDINVEIVTNMLSGFVRKVDSALDGNEAVRKFQGSGGYDIVILDLNMPTKNGYDAAKEISELPQMKSSMRIIASSADASDETRERCAEFGMHQYLSKPFSRDDLFHALQDENFHRIVLG